MDSAQTGVLESVGAPIKRFFMGAPLAERFRDEIAQLDQIPDPVQRSNAILDLRDKMYQSGYGPTDTKPVLGTHTDKAIQDALTTGGTVTTDNAARATAIMQAHGRMQPARADSLGQIMQRGTAAERNVAGAGAENARAGLYNTRAADVTTTQPYRIGSEQALAGQRGAAAGLSNTRASDVTATQGPRIDKMEAQRNQALGGGNFHVTVKNPVSGKDEVVMFDAQGNQGQTLGEAPAKGLSAMDVLQNLPGMHPPNAPAPAAPPAAAAQPQAAAPQETKVLGGKTYMKINGQWFEQ